MGYVQNQKRFRKMYPLTSIRGFDEVMQNLNAALADVRGGTVVGLVEAANFIRRETETNPPLTPVDIGNLRSSWFVAYTKSNNTPVKVTKPKGDFKEGIFKGRKKELMESMHKQIKQRAQADVNAYSSQGAMVKMGYTAYYAVYVHENIGMQVSRPGSGPKWFETAVKRNSDTIVRIVRDNVRYGGKNVPFRTARRPK